MFAASVDRLRTIVTPTLEPSLLGFTTTGNAVGNAGSRRARGSARERLAFATPKRYEVCPWFL